MPLQLTIPSIESMKDAKDFQDLWRSTSNDEGFELRLIYEVVTNRDLGPYFDRGTDDDWKQVTKLVNALERIVNILNDELILIHSEDISEFDSVETKIRETVDMSLTVFDEAILTTLLRWLRFKSDLGWDHYLIDISIPREKVVLNDQKFDVFISYRTRNYLHQARKLAHDLIARGIKVWFDEIEIGDLRGKDVIKNELAAILENAVEKSKCSIIFESSMSAAVLPPGVTEDDALKDQSMMRGPDKNLISWDWQVLEIMRSSRGLAIHGNTINLFDHSIPSTNRWINIRPGQQLIDGIMEGLQILNVW